MSLTVTALACTSFLPISAVAADDLVAKAGSPNKADADMPAVLDTLGALKGKPIGAAVGADAKDAEALASKNLKDSFGKDATSW